MIPRGTTPTFTLTFDDEDLDFTQARNIYVTFKGGKNIEKTGTDLEVTEKTVSVRLSQAETLALSKGLCEIQVNWTFADGSRAASEIVGYNFSENLVNRVVE